MMPLHGTISPEEIAECLERFDFLEGLVPAVARVDEVHDTEENDSGYVFLVWLHPWARIQAVSAEIESNLESSDSGWDYRVVTQPGFDHLVVLYTWIA